MQIRTVFITGAGSGIGATAARRFHAEGWFVGLYDLNAASVAELAAELGDNCCHGELDVCNRNAADAAVADFVAHTSGRFDALINNAGIFRDEAIVETDPAYLKLMMDVNMGGVVNCLLAAYPYLKATPDSHLVNIASTAAIYGAAHEAVYCATKFFVRGLTEALRTEWANDDIIVNTVMPSYVATPMTDGVYLSHKTEEKMLTADEVCDAIYEAATTRGMYWILPRSGRFLSFLVRKMPLRWMPAIAAKLSYGNKEPRS